MTKKNIIKIACIYTSTMLGAGFATGKELTYFFGYTKYGISSFFFSCVLLSLCCVSILSIISKTKATTYRSFMQSIFGTKIGQVLEIVNGIFLFVLFSAMLAGGGATISNLLSFDERISTFLFGIIVFIVLIYGKQAIITLNTILCPLLIIGGVFVGAYLYFFDASPVFFNEARPIISPFLYASYNTITIISILFSLKHLIINKKVVLYAGIISGLFILIIGVFMLLPLIENYPIIKDNSLPILSLLENNVVIKVIYSITVLLAIFTTAIGNGLALDCVINLNMNKTIIKGLIVVAGICFSSLGFSAMVEQIYPLFGYIGIFECLVIFITFVLTNKKDEL